MTQKAQITLLVIKKVIVLNMYLNFANIFLKKIAIKLFKYFVFNKQSIGLKPNKQLLYRSIYSLRLMKLKSLKTYIKIKLANNFIYFAKFLVETSI